MGVPPPVLLFVFAIVAGIVITHVAINLVTTTVALYDQGTLLFPAIPEEASAPWRFRAGSIGREVSAASLITLLWPIGLFPERLPRARPGREGERPLLLIHGYQHNRLALWPLALWLEKKGYVTYTFDHAAVDGVELKARQLAARVELLLKVTQSEKIDLVAHSMGGLVARYYIEVLGGHPHIGRLVTLGTPHKGTRMAIFARGQIAHDMLPGSQTLLCLGPPADQPPAIDATPPVPYTAIAGRLDTLIFPPTSALLGPPHEDVLLEHLGHNALLVHADAFQAVRDALGGGPLSTPLSPEPQ